MDKGAADRILGGPARRRRNPPVLFVLIAGLLSIGLTVVSGVWAYCYISDKPVRVGSLVVHSLRRHPNQIKYSGTMVLAAPLGARWVITQDLVLLDLNNNSLAKRLVSPKIYRLPGLAVTVP